mmetsp:Transcript_46081/g.76152  ORF Transcript_46081/g.76152 Transcript_46081/m.76152 type:complete len:215 (-) Transcript_46081:690-1334(-)
MPLHPSFFIFLHRKAGPAGLISSATRHSSEAGLPGGVYGGGTRHATPGLQMVTSAHACHTCVVSSQSQRQPSTYCPGWRSAGMMSPSTICPPVQSPEHSPCCVFWSLCAAGCVQFDAPEQSEGHGGAKDKHSNSPVCEAFSCMQPALFSPMRGTGFRAHVDPAGIVPSSTNTPCNVIRVPLFHSSACLLRLNASGVRWKHDSVSGRCEGQRRYW